MKTLALLAIAAITIVGPVFAQQTGDADRNYYVNGIGRNGTTPVGFSLPVPGPMNNTYETTAPSAPVIWGTAPMSTPDWVPGLLANSADLGPGGLTILGNGLDSSLFFNQFFFTDGSGNLNLTLVPQNNLASQTHFFSMLHFTSASPDGFYTGQVIRIQFGCNGLTSTITIGDDDNYLLDLGFAANFYGGTYTQVWVNDNGRVMFENGDDSWASIASWAASVPCIAPYYSDFDPDEGGSISVGTFTGSFDAFWVCWDEMPAWGTEQGTNSFDLTFQQVGSGAGNILFSYGVMTRMGGNYVFMTPAAIDVVLAAWLPPRQVPRLAYARLLGRGAESEPIRVALGARRAREGREVAGRATSDPRRAARARPATVRRVDSRSTRRGLHPP